jgi:hypothetical protein
VQGRQPALPAIASGELPFNSATLRAAEEMRGVWVWHGVLRQPTEVEILRSRPGPKPFEVGEREERKCPPAASGRDARVRRAWIRRRRADTHPTAHDDAVDG